ncbi:hypothetical protein ACAS46_002743 [Vibrio vulnificus]
MNTKFKSEAKTSMNTNKFTSRDLDAIVGKDTINISLKNKSLNRAIRNHAEEYDKSVTATITHLISLGLKEYKRMESEK